MSAIAGKMHGSSAESPLTERRGLASRLNRFDAIAVAIFALIAVVALLGRWSGGHVEILSGDAAAYASAVLAKMEPHRFVGDFMLENPSVTAFNQTALAAYLQIAAVPFGGIANAFVALLLPATFIQLSGFFLLARRYIPSALISFVFAATTLLLVNIGINGEFWGLFYDPLARILYQAAFPWLLILALSRPYCVKVQIGTLAASGLLVYVHPHSAVTQAFALLCGFAALKSPGESWLKHGSRLFGLGVLFLVLAAPFAFIFISNTSGSGIPDPALAREISVERFGIFYHAPWLMTLKFAVWCSPFLLALGLGGYRLWQRRPDLHGFSIFLAGWGCGLVFIAVLAPSVEHVIAAMLPSLPFEYDFVRSLRYVIPLAWLILFIAGYESVHTWFDGARAAIVMSTVTLAALALGVQSKYLDIPTTISRGVVCIANATMPCPYDDRERDVHRLLRAIENFPEGSRFLPETSILGLTIRHAARRPVVFTSKEGGWFLYAKQFDLMVEWNRRLNAFKKLQSFVAGNGKITDEARWVGSFVRLAREFGAHYIVMARDARLLESLPSGSVMFASPHASLVQIPSAGDRSTSR